MIKSLLDQDLYKFTMQQAVLHNFPDATVKYKLKCRNPKINFTKAYPYIVAGIKALEGLALFDSELEYLKSLRFIKSDFIDFLKIYRLDTNYVTCKLIGNDLEITVEGPWLYTIHFEILLLAIISESFHTKTIAEHDCIAALEVAICRNHEKIQLVKPTSMQFADFGTRRRFSHELQDILVANMTNELPRNFIGTSNLYFAKKHNITAIGTMAHEWLQGCQAVGPRLRDSQKFALNTWVQEYRGDLGIALSDVIHMQAFLKDFDLFFCKLFDGVRQDSGNPYEWGNELIDHYNKMGIDPRTKSGIFSNELNIPLAIELHNYFKDKIKPSFGIGTNLMCDTEGIEPLKIVIKMIECNGQPVAKISNDRGKTMCENDSYVDYLRSVFESTH